MNHKDLTVCKANRVVEAGYKLSLNEQRVILACIGQVDSMRELSVTHEFELSAKDFAVLFVMSENNAYHALLDVVETLFNRYVIVDNPYPDRPRVKRLKMRWISSIEYSSEESKISLCFSQKILPFLSELKNTFTKYRLEHVGKMTSVYAIRLYELLVQWQSTGKREVEVAWLKKQFQIEEGYEQMCDLKKRVLDPAVKDINEHSNLQVEWVQRKTGRRVTHLIFTFSEKESAKPVTAPQIDKPAKPVATNKPAPAQRLSKYELEQQRFAELTEIENKKHLEREKQRDYEIRYKELRIKLRNEFGQQVRDGFLSSLNEQQQQQLLDDILAETTAKEDYFATGSIIKKGLTCLYARGLINDRIANFAEKRDEFVEQQLKLHGF